MFRRLGRGDEARESYRRALQFASNDQVRRFIERRLNGADAESRAKGLV
jgi:predicted RNA polymerase sigma factor